MRRLLFAVLVTVCALSAVTIVEGQPFPPAVQQAINSLTTGVTPFTALRNVASAYINWGSVSGTNGYGFRDSAGTIQVKNSAGAWADIVSGSASGAPADATYWVRTANATLSNETILGALGTGLVINTTTTGVPTIYAGATCTNQVVTALSASGAATCSSVAAASFLTGIVPVANGGTGLASGTSGGILAYTGSGTLVSSSVLTANRLMLGGGAGVAPSVLSTLGTSGQVLHGNAGGAPTFSAVSLTADVSGILPTANGGTGIAFFTAAGPSVARVYTFPDAAATILTTNTAVTAAQGGTGQTTYTIGDILQATGATTLTKLAGVSTGNALISGGVATASSWGKIGLSTHVSGTLLAVNGGTGFASYAVGDLLYAVSTTTLAKLADVAVGSVLISGGVGTAPAWSTAPRVTSLLLGADVALSATAPTVSSGFGTSPSIAGTASSFRINVGTGGSATAGVLAMPTATTGWNCHVENLTATTANAMDQRTVQLSSTTTTVTIENQTVTTGAALAWTASDIVSGICVAY